ncbi:A/G-specific adenine glycosylase [Ferruginibacter sp. SUN106]|uniref:A/G-specific adenine glycosylase n=1 Tax=Ferruginibacter sp. SUN106 TaxID=2978348 RepID=UPI003D3601BF
MDDTYKFFTKQLLQWNNKTNDRPMPWKGEKDPYKIWLSEIILQQTRVEQGWDYYNRFIVAFPTIDKLAKAPETKVFKLWEGLGYYTRCKNLIATAKLITKEYGGKFPGNYEAILNLKGVGPYTAAAIASFAYNLPYAVVDGNVFRVLSRFFANSIAIDSTEGKKLFTTLANELLDKKQPGIYNQALMDFGAVVCKPKQPLCKQCPLQSSCGAYLKGLVEVLPVKEKKITQKTRWLFYFIIEHEGKVFVRKRGVKDIWENLYEFVLIESAEATEVAQLQKLPAFKKLLGKNGFTVATISRLYSQKLTHQTIHGQFITLQLKKTAQIEGYEPVTQKELLTLPFPKFITSYLKDKNVSLNLL